ncbi:MAG: MBL fold metallo-hydrolase RNA specificity domain-containing protein [Pseudomonadota bacterium]
MASLTFVGAAREVTGSCYLLETAHDRILLDCGMRQGRDDVGRRNVTRFPFRPREIRAVVLSHAHLDHSGLLPRLVHEGFSGPIYCTSATRNLLAIMLADAAHLYLRDIEWENRQLARRGQRLLTPQYELPDVLRVLELCVPLEYGACVRVGEDTEVCFHDAGHILGSAIVDLQVRDGGRRKRLVFSGDLGSRNAVLMQEPARLTEADLVLMESTYGNRNHRGREETVEEFAGILAAAWKEGGSVLIPAFAVGRTQDILFTLGILHHQGRLNAWKVFLDSPMAIEVTRLYDSWRDQLDHHDVDLMEKYRGTTLEKFVPGLRPCNSVEESMAINRVERGAIIIAGSGMCSGGRIRHHLKHRLYKPETHLVFVGFQAQGTLGRQLVDGAKNVRLMGQRYVVNAQVHTLGGFSAHAGQDELIDWLSAFRNKPRVQLVHGEPAAQAALAEKLWQQRQIAVDIPGPGSVVEL